MGEAAGTRTQSEGRWHGRLGRDPCPMGCLAWLLSPPVRPAWLLHTQEADAQGPEGQGRGFPTSGSLMSPETSLLDFMPRMPNWAVASLRSFIYCPSSQLQEHLSLFPGSRLGAVSSAPAGISPLGHKAGHCLPPARQRQLPNR